MKRRQAFTLVELLVSMALIIFIMAILSQAFAAALNTFRNLKAEGDMAEKLRAVSQLLQLDLAADHFEGKKRLSNPNFWVEGPPSQGYFRIWQGTPTTASGPNNWLEGADTDVIGSYRSVDHMLAFSVKQRGNDMGSFFSASAPPAALTASASFGPIESRYQLTSGGTYNYQWAEVAWFLQPSINPNTQQQDMTDGSIKVPLYTLYRRQRLLVPDNYSVHLPPADPFAYSSALQYASTTYPSCLELSCWDNPPANPTLGQIPGQVPGSLYFNNPTDITVPTRRFGMVSSTLYPAGLLYGIPVTSPPTYPAGAWPYPPNATPPAGVWFAPSSSPPTPPTYWPPLPPPYQPPLIPYYPTLAQQGAGANLAGADIQINDVISFDVRVLEKTIAPLVIASGNADPFVTLFDTNVQSTFSSGNPAFFNATTNPTAPAVFDTWTSVNDGFSNYSSWNNATANPAVAIPLWSSSGGMIIKALQISIRIWDYKTNQTRQVTIVQAM